jgi:hypothetical protein
MKDKRVGGNCLRIAQTDNMWHAAFWNTSSTGKGSMKGMNGATAMVLSYGPVLGHGHCAEGRCSKWQMTSMQQMLPEQ